MKKNYENTNESYESVSLKSVLPLFILLFIGILLSLIAVICEHIIFFVRNHKVFIV